MCLRTPSLGRFKLSGLMLLRDLGLGQFGAAGFRGSGSGLRDLGLGGLGFRL